MEIHRKSGKKLEKEVEETLDLPNIKIYQKTRVKTLWKWHVNI